jgi:plasmid stabilization system protein ParE
VRLRFTSSAEQELREAIEFYDEVENGLGGRLLDEIEAATERIFRNPMAWAAMSRRTRRCRTNRFPYGLFYQIRQDEILIVAVMDLRRDPKRWEEFL